MNVLERILDETWRMIHALEAGDVEIFLEVLKRREDLIGQAGREAGRLPASEKEAFAREFRKLDLQCSGLVNGLLEENKELRARNREELVRLRESGRAGRSYIEEGSGERGVLLDERK